MTPEFQTHPSRYRHWQLAVDGRRAELILNVDESAALQAGAALKLNSYDLGVDIELRDAVRRLRLEHPEVGCIVIRSALPDVFCAGANIQSLAGASHETKVNFCKYTNETRLEIEEASRAGQVYIAALQGTASGGGYELALACERILLVDDRRAAVSLPEVSLLAVLPGTGGLTRLVDKRGVRRDLADRFCTLQEGVRAARALEWGLVDAIAPPSRFDALVAEEVARVLDEHPGVDAAPVALEPLAPKLHEGGFAHRYVNVDVDAERRCAEIRVEVPGGDAAVLPRLAVELARELEDTWLRLRFLYPEAGVWLLRCRGRAVDAYAFDAALDDQTWLAGEARALLGRVLKQLDNSARSIFAAIDAESCFVGTFLELALAADQSFMLDDPGAPVHIELSAPNLGAFPTASGLTRLEARFYGRPEALERARSARGPLAAPEAAAAELVTTTPDDIDYGDELRLAIEERASFSPDALTGLEANLRVPGPETLETKIFGRLSAWQNWVFQRPNAAGPEGALESFGRPEQAKYDWKRT